MFILGPKQFTDRELLERLYLWMVDLSFQLNDIKLQQSTKPIQLGVKIENMDLSWMRYVI